MAGFVKSFAKGMAGFVKSFAKGMAGFVNGKLHENTGFLWKNMEYRHDLKIRFHIVLPPVGSPERLCMDPSGRVGKAGAAGRMEWLWETIRVRPWAWRSPAPATRL